MPEDVLLRVLRGAMHHHLFVFGHVELALEKAFAKVDPNATHFVSTAGFATALLSLDFGLTPDHAEHIVDAVAVGDRVQYLQFMVRLRTIYEQQYAHHLRHGRAGGARADGRGYKELGRLEWIRQQLGLHLDKDSKLMFYMGAEDDGTITLRRFEAGLASRRGRGYQQILRAQNTHIDCLRRLLVAGQMRHPHQPRRRRPCVCVLR